MSRITFDWRNEFHTFSEDSLVNLLDKGWQSVDPLIALQTRINAIFKIKGNRIVNQINHDVTEFLEKR